LSAETDSAQMTAAPVISVTDLDDERISVFRDLKSSRMAQDRGWFIAEGENIVLRLVASQHEVVSILMAENRQQRLLPRLARPVPCFFLPEERLKELAGFDFHRGVIACGVRKPLPSIRELFANHPGPVSVVILAGIMDAENLGAILRTCAALGVDAVLLGDRTLDPYYRRVVRVSMGAVFSLPLALSADLKSDLQWLQETARVDLFATVLDDLADPLGEVIAPPRWGLLLGNESSGIPPSLQALCRMRVTLPMQRSTDSLNVSVAAGIFIHHFSAS
jgi:tRNA G18 (ribose-2'-O)-methylase SpoU